MYIFYKRNSLILGTGDGRDLHGVPKHVVTFYRAMKTFSLKSLKVWSTKTRIETKLRNITIYIYIYF